MSPAPSLQRLVLVLALALVAGPLAAGCIEADDAVTGLELRLLDDPKPSSATYLLDAAWTLVEATNDTTLEPGRTALGDFYGPWAAGGPFPEWRSAPLTEPMVATGAAMLTFYVTTDTAVTSTPGIFPDFVLYFGTTKSVMSDFSPRAIRDDANGHTALGPGEIVEVSAQLVLPDGGIIIPAGEGLRIVVAPVMMETDANDLYVLHGDPDHLSRVDLTWVAPDTAPWEDDEPTTVTHDVQVIAGTFQHGTEVDGTTVSLHPVDITNGTSALLVDLVFDGDTPFPDMDLYVYGPRGTGNHPGGVEGDRALIARSVTPGDTESVHLYTPNLAIHGPGEYLIKVVNYVTPGAVYHVDVTTLAPAAL